MASHPRTICLSKVTQRQWSDGTWFVEILELRSRIFISGQEAEDFREPETPGQRSGRPTESRFRRRPLAEAGRSGRAPEGRVFRKVRADS